MACAKKLAVPALLLLLVPLAGAQKTAGRLLVDLDAGDASAGTQTWVNSGKLGDFSAHGNPAVVRHEGIQAVRFDGQSGYEGPDTSASLEDAKPRSIEVWAWNDDLTGEETLVAWGQRGGEPGSNMALGFGKSPGLGAADHGKHGLGWMQLPPRQVWCHLVYSYDGEVARVFLNGSQMNERAIELMTPSGTTLRVAGQHGKDGGWAAPGTLSISRLRVHSDALTPGEVEQNFLAEAGTYGAIPWSELRKMQLEDPELQKRINDAITRGAQAVIDMQELDGSWSHAIGKYGSGQTGLALYALLKSGLPQDHPTIQRGLEFIVQNPPDMTYSAGCVMMALGSLSGTDHDELLEELAERMISWQDGSGGWGYPHPNIDLSNTQYAVLGLRAAATRGIKIPKRVWERAAKYALNVQESGNRRAARGFRYHGGGGATGSMTAAGIAVLSVASQQVKRPPRDWTAALGKGLAWIEENFTVDINPYPGSNEGHQNTHHRYYQYGLERVGSLMNVEQIGEHDWYSAGALQLCDSQNDQGKWGGQHDTCFGLLFLTRATSKNKPTSGRGTRLTEHMYGSDDPGADLSLRASGKDKLAIWVSSLGEYVLEDYAWEGEDGRLRVVRVDYFTVAEGEEQLLQSVSGDPDKATSNLRFPMQHLFRPGEHRLRARMLVREPGGTDITLESPLLTVKVDRGLAPELLEYARHTGQNQLAGAQVVVQASTPEGGGHAPEKAVDGYSSTWWQPTKEDSAPSLTIRLERPVRGNRVALTHPLQDKTNQKARGRIKRIELRVNGTAMEVELESSAWRKTIVELPKVATIRSIKVTVLEVFDNAHPGLAEVEVLMGD